MTKQEQIARLAIARAQMRGVMVVIATDSQRKMIQLLREIDPRAVLSLVGTDGVRVHQAMWGQPPLRSAA